jgi:methionyl-tRNA synthetase
MLHHMSSTEYLNYEGTKFSKSKGIGVFGTDAVASGIPADVWRFYIFYNRPEKGDYFFTWSDFLEKVNGELIGNLGNLANRTLTFVARYFGGEVPRVVSGIPARGPASAPSSGAERESFRAKVAEIEARASAHLERAELRDAFRAAFELSDLANKRFQDGEPWKTRVSDPDAAKALIADLCYVLRDLAIMVHPYIPAAASKLASFFGMKIGEGGLSWKDLGSTEGLTTVSQPEVLFSKLEDDRVAELRERFSGSQKERKEREEARPPAAEPPAKQPPAAPKVPPLADLPIEERFERLIDLRVAKIVKIERHPKADKLYVETLDDGSGQERVIVSGLVPFYKEEELLGKHIVLVSNLKPAKLRGVESRGMLLAASRKVAGEPGPQGQSTVVKEAVEVLEAPWAAPGTRLGLEGRPIASEAAATASPSATPEIEVDDFFSVPIEARGGAAYIGASRLSAEGRALSLLKVPDGEVG